MNALLSEAWHNIHQHLSGSQELPWNFLEGAQSPYESCAVCAPLHPRQPALPLRRVYSPFLKAYRDELGSGKKGLGWLEGWAAAGPGFWPMHSMYKAGRGCVGIQKKVLGWLPGATSSIGASCLAPMLHVYKVSRGVSWDQERGLRVAVWSGKQQAKLLAWLVEQKVKDPACKCGFLYGKWRKHASLGRIGGWGCNPSCLQD